MSRYPHAANVLIAQALDHDPSTKVEAASEPDGYEVVRSIRFSKRVSHYLAPLLLEIKDPRIIGLDNTKDGLTVTFSDRTIADRKDPFPLLDAATIVDDGADTGSVPPTHGVDEDDAPLPVDKGA